MTTAGLYLKKVQKNSDIKTIAILASITLGGPVFSIGAGADPTFSSAVLNQSPL